VSLDAAIAAATWEELTGHGVVATGAVAPVRRVTVSADTVGRVRRALAAALGEIDVPVGVADVCPDPLVFALTAGLPRLSGFTRTIDGGSAWRDEAPVRDGELYAVSRISGVAQRHSGDGRLMVRVVYSTRFTDGTGAPVGTADGVSIHIGAGA